MIEEFNNYYRILEEKIAQKDFSNHVEIEEKKPRKDPKLSQRQIFYLTKSNKKPTK
tara:strand:+ start:285 stop:452 length:168 start_codon:yes stop_codon:yes gene_type:complete